MEIPHNQSLFQVIIYLGNEKRQNIDTFGVMKKNLLLKNYIKIAPNMGLMMQLNQALIKVNTEHSALKMEK